MDAGAFIIGLVALVLVVGAIAGIYYSIKEKFIDPVNKRKKDEQVAGFKFAEFIQAIQAVVPTHKVMVADELKYSVRETITNGVDPIGHFDYTIEDQIKFASNDVGKVKMHSYTVIVSCTLKPNVFIETKSQPYDIPSNLLNRAMLAVQKEDIMSKQQYKNAIAVNQIR